MEGNRKVRLEWIDAMRGFTMILVVAYHVALQGFDEEVKLSSSLPFLVLFRMPLFFFISGFLSYRSNADWSFRGLTQMIG
ncbi:MAG: acyltransferase family protein, partial [Prevotellaceae bacterium]|nr:acyltransferase family protein [Prevotellaceae bacterium]